MKKIICIFLSICICLLGCVSVSAEEKKLYPDYPTLYIQGMGQSLVTEAGNMKSEQIYPPVTDTEEISAIVSSLIPSLMKGIATDNWDDYCDGLYNAIAPMYARCACDVNGDVTDGSGCIVQNIGLSYEKKVSPIIDSKHADFYIYYVAYDWRLDPYVLAEQLHSYIDKILTKTKAEKVNIISRCFGVNIVLAYADLYGAEELNKVVMYCSGFDGIEAIGAAMAGNIDLDSDSIEYFTNCYFQSEDYSEDPLMQLLRASISFLNKTAGLDVASFLVQRCYENVYENVLPRIMMDTFGTMPSFWAMVGDEYYDTAKELIFKGKEETYAGLIAKIDNYHEKLGNSEKAKEVITRMQQDGSDVYIIAKYGFAMLPLNKSLGDIQSDMLVTTSNSSLGAVCSPLTGTFSEDYLQWMTNHKLSGYISPDNKIDASTCFLRDKTWFIKNISHRNMPTCVNPLIRHIIMTDGSVDIHIDATNFPQFLVCDDAGTEMTPMTAENGSTDSKVKMTFWQTIVSFFRSLVAVLKNYFSKN